MLSGMVQTTGSMEGTDSRTIEVVESGIEPGPCDEIDSDTCEMVLAAMEYRIARRPSHSDVSGLNEKGLNEKGVLGSASRNEDPEKAFPSV